MPVARVQLPDGRIGRFDVPEGTTPDQVIQFASQGLQQPEAPAPQAPTQPAPTLNSFQYALQNKTVGYGLADVAAQAPVQALNAFNRMVEGAGYNAGAAVTDATKSPGFGTAVNTAIQAIPMVAGGEVLKPLSAAVGNPMARWLMQSSLKPTLPMRQSGKAADAVQTMLDQGYNVTKGGVEAMEQKISDLSDKVKQAVANSGATIDTRSIADYVPNAFERFRMGPQSQQAVEDLGNVQSNFLNHPEVGGANQIPVQLAQDLKTGYQRSIGDKGYGELRSPSTEGEKQIARGLREKISEAVPSTAADNALQKKLIDAKKIASRAVELDSNKNPLGFGALLTQPWMIPVWMWDRSPWLKSYTARALASPIAQSLPGSVAGALYDVGNLGNQGSLYQK